MSKPANPKTYALDNYVLLGASGLRVSPLCLGTMTFGTEWGWGADKDDSRAIFAAYAEKGGNFIDTANRYTQGTSEEYVGDFVREERWAGGRERYVIATKCTLNMREGDPNAGGNHRKNIVQSVEASLRRLKTDYIDLFWIHVWEFRTPVEETMRALDDLVRAGKLLYIGISDVPAWKVAQANTLAALRGWTSFCALQIEYSLIERTVERELMPMARELGIGVTPWSPLAGGVLSGKYNLAKARAQAAGEEMQWEEGTRAQRLKDGLSGEDGPRRLGIAQSALDVATELGFDPDAPAGTAQATPSQVALAWLLRQPGVSSPIIGARTLAQVEDNLGALALASEGSALTEEHCERLSEVSKVDPGFPMRFLNNPGLRQILDGGTVIETRWP